MCHTHPDSRFLHGVHPFPQFPYGVHPSIPDFHGVHPFPQFLYGVHRVFNYMFFKTYGYSKLKVDSTSGYRNVQKLCIRVM